MNKTDDIRKLKLEVGNSVFELIEFSLTRRVRGQVVKGVYGINVVKVREVVRMPRINMLASRIKGIAGLFELRGVPIPAVDLKVALGDDEPPPSQSNQQQIIVAEFSQKRAGFIVDETHRIRRVAWDKVLPPSADSASFITGMTLVDENEFLFILDLERILLALEFGDRNPFYGFDGDAPPLASTSFVAQASLSSAPNEAQGPRILLAEDSQLIRNSVRHALHKAGYRVTEARDGLEAMKLLDEAASGRGAPYDLLVTDIEMPRLDGLSLTRKLRAHPHYASLPIVLHSSLSGRANIDAGISIGANGYVVKNDLRTLFELLQEILGHELAPSVSA